MSFVDVMGFKEQVQRCAMRPDDSNDEKERSVDGQGKNTGTQFISQLSW